jgi:hypothetical protein
MLKACESCSKQFECNVDDIANCQCSTVFIINEVKDILQKKYNDCVCINCIKDLHDNVKLKAIQLL